MNRSFQSVLARCHLISQLCVPLLNVYVIPERLTTESEKRVKELEGALSSQACSARTTLELVRGQMQAEHADTLQRMKEQHRKDMGN